MDVKQPMKSLFWIHIFNINSWISKLYGDVEVEVEVEVDVDDGTAAVAAAFLDLGEDDKEDKGAIARNVLDILRDSWAKRKIANGELIVMDDVDAVAVSAASNGERCIGYPILGLFRQVPSFVWVWVV